MLTVTDNIANKPISPSPTPAQNRTTARDISHQPSTSHFSSLISHHITRIKSTSANTLSNILYHLAVPSTTSCFTNNRPTLHIKSSCHEEVYSPRIADMLSNQSSIPVNTVTCSFMSRLQKSQPVRVHRKSIRHRCY